MIKKGIKVMVVLFVIIILFGCPSPETNSFTITANAGALGSISPSGSITVGTGNNQSFTILPDQEYQISDVIVDGTSIGPVTSYTFTNVTANHSIYAAFTVLASYTIAASAGVNGGISPSGSIAVDPGNNQSFAILPNPRYEISDVLIDGISAGPVESYTFSNVTANHTIHAAFTGPISYTIITSAGAHGSISPSGSITVDPGNNQSFEITADPGYQVSDVVIDGVSIGPAERYTFNNVTANHTIHAVFTEIPPQYTITASAETNGSISPSGSVLVNQGNSQSFTILPNPGYQIADVLIDGTPIGPFESYTFSNVTADHTIHATFTGPCPHTITADTDDNGMIDPAGSVQVEHGNNQTFTIIPGRGYRILDVIVDGSSVGPVEEVEGEAEYTFYNVTENHSIYATFEVIPFTPDPVGTWRCELYEPGWPSSAELIFNADNTVCIDGSCYGDTWNLDGNTLTWTIINYTNWVAEFDTKDRMHGTVSAPNPPSSDFIAYR